jgi:FixJ family two-component response regulator
VDSLTKPIDSDALIAAGLMNKQSAAMLDISVVTLQNHRGQIMRKMAAASLAELVRMCGALGIPHATHEQSKGLRCSR